MTTNVESLCQRIVNGESIDTLSYFNSLVTGNLTSYYDDIEKTLKSDPNNANCLFYLAELYRYNMNKGPHSPNDIILLYREAAKREHIQAQYELAKIYLDRAWGQYDHFDDGIELLIQLYRNDVVKPENGCEQGTIFESRRNIAVIKYLIDKQDNLNQVIKQKDAQIEQLNNKILELEYRPPELGGTQYREAKAHFETLRA